MPHTPVDLIALREPALLVPYRKPAVPVKIDYSNPLSNGLVDCYLFNERIGAAKSLVENPTWGDLSPGTGVAGNNAEWVSSDRGAGIFCDANKECFISTTQTQIPAWPASIACSWKSSGTQVQYPFLWYAEVTDRFSMTFDTNASNTFYFNDLTFPFGDGGTYANFTDGNWHNLVATSEKNTRRDLYINQDHHSWGTNVGLPPDTDDYLCINGRDDANTRYAYGVMVYWYLWDRELSEGEAREINRDPYQIFKPI